MEDRVGSGKGRWSHRVKAAEEECSSRFQRPEEPLLPRAAMYSGAGC